MPPCVTFRLVIVSLRGLDSHPFFPSHVASGRCFLSVAAASARRGSGTQGTNPHSAAQSTQDTVQERTPPASTMKRTLPATNKERALRTHNPRSGGAFMVYGWDNMWRSRAPGPHAHGNTARQVVNGLRTEVCGQREQSNNPRNNQHNPNALTTGHR